jgi:uncharacterized protein
MTAPTRTNADTARTVYQVFGAGDIPALLDLLADDVAWESDWEDNFAQRPGGPAFYRPFTGRDNLGPFFEAMGRNEFAMLEVRDVIADGDRVVARIGLEYALPGGGRYRDEQLHLWTFTSGGKIASVRHFLDTAKLLAAAAGRDTTVVPDPVAAGVPGSKAGPRSDPAFFDALGRVFDQFPDVAEKYSISFDGYAREAVGASGSAVARSRSDGDRIVTTYVERTTASNGDDDPCAPNGFCARWFRGECVECYFTS